MPGQCRDHPSSIHARSAHRPPQLHQCQVSAETPQIHPCQLSTQTTPYPSMPGQCKDIPDPSLPGQHSDHPAPSMPGQCTDHPTSIHARSAHRPPQLHPFQVSTQITPPPDFLTWGFGKGTENTEELDFGGHWDLIIELPQD